MIRENEQILANDRRLCDYRMRSGDLLSVLEIHRKRWKSQLKQNEKKQRELIGNTILFSIYRAHLLCQERSVSSISVSMCTSHLNSVSVQFDSSTVTSSNVINRILRNLKSSRRFCLFLSSHESLLQNLQTVLPGATYLDMSLMKWKDSQMTSSLSKHVYSIVPTVFFNVSEVPPPEMYEILMKSEEKEVCFHNKSIELPDDILFVFVAKQLGHIPDQIRKLMEVIVVSSQLDPIEDTEKTEK
uniref:General transcription factor IIH subunit 4 n=1 Tax=Caenorhabditis tropicalis TaxID=1561998 RepID=A0A1I7TLZ9_9PELO